MSKLELFNANLPKTLLPTTNSRLLFRTFVKNKTIPMDIFVGSIPFKLKEKELKELFEKFGEVTSVKIVKSKVTRQNKGFAFVDMPDEEEVRKAIFELNGLEIMGRNIEVSISEKIDKSKPKTVKSTKLNSQGKLMTKKVYTKPFGMNKSSSR